MPLPYTQNKKHIYSWREANKEKYNEIAKIHMRRRYAWLRVCKEFRRILIDGY